MATLKRLSDGAGETGPRVEAIEWNYNGSIKAIKGNRPMVGYTLFVGSLTAKIHNNKDYWLTTAVTEILKEEFDIEKNLKYVKFRTGNSTYELTY